MKIVTAIDSFKGSMTSMEARAAAEDFHERLKIPFIELRRLYQTDKIENQYQAFGSVLGVTFDTTAYRKAAEQAVENFRKVCPDASFAVGECMNGDPFELALALLKYGFKVPEIYGTITAENFVYMKQLALLSPLRRKTGFLIQNQIEIRLRHRLIFFKISASGYLVDCLNSCTVKEIIQLTVIH